MLHKKQQRYYKQQIGKLLFLKKVTIDFILDNSISEVIRMKIDIRNNACGIVNKVPRKLTGVI